MKYDEDKFFGIGTYVSVVVIFALAAVIFWAFDHRRKKKFVQIATQNNEMTREHAETLYKIRGNRALLEPTGPKKRFRRLDAFQSRNFHAENFFQLHRWIKNIKDAKRNGRLDDYADQLIRQMEDRMHIFPLSATDQKRLWQLSLLPENVLSKYDHEHNGLLVA